ncbi:MAG: HNH endonuclease [Candidatus Zixiibacteriota bacterium]
MSFKPKLSLVGNTIVSDICVWCGEKSKMSKSHLIPQFLGGWFQPKISCEKCNSFLGSKIEEKAKNNAFITAAMVKLGLANEQVAYKKLKKIDVENEVEVDFKGSVAIPRIKWLDERTLIAPSVKSKKIRIDRIKKKYPHIPMKPIEDFFNDPDKTDFRYDNIVIAKRDYLTKKTKIKMEGTRDPDNEFIFKLLYEFMCLNNFLKISGLRNSLRKYIHIDKNDVDNRIKIDDKLRKNIFYNTANTFKLCDKLEEIPFTGCHYFVLRLSSDNILYIEVTLFGQLRNFFIIDEWRSEYEVYAGILDRVFLFTIDRQGFPPFMYPNLNLKEHLLWVDAMVKIKWQRTL